VIESLVDLRGLLRGLHLADIEAIERIDEL
jgi:hypothetical protein